MYIYIYNVLFRITFNVTQLVNVETKTKIVFSVENVFFFTLRSLEVSNPFTTHLWKAKFPSLILTIINKFMT